MPGPNLRILFIPLEFQEWSRARHLSYASFLGLEEAFLANKMDVTTLPANVRHSAWESDVHQPGYWLESLRMLCRGRKFDQVWVEIVHARLNEDILSFLSESAPIRVALVGESLECGKEVGERHPRLGSRKALVEGRLHAFTHAIVADERDAADLNARAVIQALWAPQSIPERFIDSSDSTGPAQTSYLCEPSERELAPWADKGRLGSLLSILPVPAASAKLAENFDSIHSRLAVAPDSLPETSWEKVYAYLDAWRTLRSESFRLRLQGLASGAAVVNLPSYFQGYSARVFEGMAAGRPVVSWDVPNRPRNRALFLDGEEILLYPHGNPDNLVGHLESLIRDPIAAARIARNARNKIWRFHTSEKRIQQILEWIDSGAKPLLEERELAPSVGVAVEAFWKRFGTSAAQPESVVPTSVLDRVRRAESFAAQGRAKEAIAELEAAGASAPGDVCIQRTLGILYSTSKDFRKASQAFFQAIQTAPNDSGLWIECARACIEDGDIPMAQAAVEGALAIDPADADANMLFKAINDELSAGRIPAKAAVDSFYEEFFLRSPEYASPHPNREEAARWDKIEVHLRAVRDERVARGLGAMRILDLGCGRGWIANLASGYGECEGMEPVAMVIEAARRLFPLIKFYACEAAELREDPAFRPYDLIINSEVIEHVPWPHKESFVKDMASLLAPGGQIILTTPRGEVFDEYMRIVNNRRQPIEDWTTEEQTRALFKASGFTAKEPERIWIRFPDCAYFPAATPEQERAGLMSIYQVWRFQPA